MFENNIKSGCIPLEIVVGLGGIIVILVIIYCFSVPIWVIRKKMMDDERQKVAKAFAEQQTHGEQNENYPMTQQIETQDIELYV